MLRTVLLLAVVCLLACRTTGQGAVLHAPTKTEKVDAALQFERLFQQPVFIGGGNCPLPALNGPIEMIPLWYPYAKQAKGPPPGKGAPFCE